MNYMKKMPKTNDADDKTFVKYKAAYDKKIED
jgi:hypothetical protein